MISMTAKYSGAVSQIKIGLTSAQAVEASDAVRLIAATIPHTISCAIANGQYKQIQTPSAVAMPLPPLNDEKIGKRWPRIAANAQRDCSVLDKGKSRPGSSANIPLPISPKSVNVAALAEPIRKTLVVPGLPEPCWRGSGILKA